MKAQAAPSGSDPVEALLQELKQYQQRQLDDPGDHEAPFRCGEIFTRLGDFDAAIESYRLAVQRHPTFVEAFHNMGRVYAARNHLDDAENAYRQALRLRPADAQVRTNLAAALEAQGRVDDAIHEYRSAIEVDPAEAPARHRLGMLYLEQGDPRRARQVFEEALERDEGHAEAWYGLGLVAFRTDRVADARSYYLKAVEADPEYGAAWNNLGNVFARLEEESAAEEAYRKAARFSPDDPDVWFNLGEFYFRHHHPEAEACLARAVELNRTDMEAWEMLRQWYQHHPHYPNWQSVLKVLLTARPRDPDLLGELARVQVQLGEPDEAVATLRRLVDVDPQDEQPHLELASLLLKLGRIGDAYHHLSHVRALGDDVLDMWTLLGQRLLHQEHPGEAEQCFLTVVAHRPGDSCAWQFLGELSFRKEQWDAAFERFSRAGDMNRNQVGVWRPLAERFRAQGDAARAAGCLEFLAELWPHLPDQWSELWPFYRDAGQGDAFLDRLQRDLERLGATNAHWLSLAQVNEHAGRAGQARACMERVEAGETQEPDLALARYHVQRREGAQALEQLLPLEAQHGDRPGYWMHRGDAHYLTDDLEAAAAAYRRMLELDDRDFRGWFKLGNCAYRTGQHEAAEEAFAAAARRQPDEPKTWYNLGLAQAERGRLAAARESFNKALARHRRFAQAWNWLGIVALRQGDDRLARRAFLRCLVSDRRSATGWYNLAMWYRKQQDEEKSARCLERAERLGGVRADDAVVISPRR